MASYQVAHQAIIPFPASQVIDWYRRPAALLQLLPPWRSSRVLFCKERSGQNGARLGIELSFAGVKSKWILEKTESNKEGEFVVQQAKGPFVNYRHVSRFQTLTAQNCKIEEEIAYRLPLGFPFFHLQREKERELKWRHRKIQDELAFLSRYPIQRQKILLSGSSGLLGSSLKAFLKAAGHEVIPLVRFPSKSDEKTVVWDPEREQFCKADFEGFDGVIHLAGENIAAGRWTAGKKKRLFLSRCRDTWLLSQILVRLDTPPSTLICASAIGYYGNRSAERLSEGSLRGNGFLADLCAKWEAASQVAEQKGIRVLHARLGVVLSRQGGMLPKILVPYRFGLGGKLGSGRQVMSWVEIDDVVRACYHLLMTRSLRGPINVVAPQPIQQQEFAHELGKRMRRPCLLSVPKVLLHYLLGEIADELILADQYVEPRKLLETGYEFRYPVLSQALEDLI
jgi:uncharacterized protein (TIGR01777 family)